MFIITLHQLDNKEKSETEFREFCERIICDILLHHHFAYQDYKSYSLIKNLTKKKRMEFIDTLSRSKEVNNIDDAVDLISLIFDDLGIATIEEVMYIADMCYVKLNKDNENYVIEIKRKICQKES
jgi:hypothetical protein